MREGRFLRTGAKEFGEREKKREKKKGRRKNMTRCEKE